MHIIDWLVLASTIIFIVVYGMWKTRVTSSVESYLIGDRDLKWWTIGLSIMATQASGITFLSTPGQAYEEGMGFIQFYLGLPIAMVILSVYFLPKFYNLKVYTAYEYLEQRFGLRARTLTAIIFLIQRGFSAGLTIYAPSIIMAKILDWNLGLTNLAMGGIVIAYTVVGGTKAVSETQQQQMAIILFGLFAALLTVLYKLPQDVSFTDAVNVAGHLGKMNIIDFKFNPESRYNIWSGMLGGTFLFLSYFGTDQSQVQRYLSGKTLTESRLGLLFNGLLKVPMQFTVLFVGMMVFVFYLFNPSPLHYNTANVANVRNSTSASAYQEVEKKHFSLAEAQRLATYDLVQAQHSHNQSLISEKTAIVNDLLKQDATLRTSAKEIIKQNDKAAETKDTDYVFITFVLNNMPIGLIGLLIAVIFAAAMSSISSEINALATTTIIDIYRRSLVKTASDEHYLLASKWFTVFWGGIALSFSALASLFDNLIQAVNIIGSIFYGVILGIFLVAFFFKKIQENAVVIAAAITQAVIIALFFADKQGYIKIGFLWFNLIGPFLVIVLSILLQNTIFKNSKRNLA
jgi:solute:Na+ symporter, SSS family